MKLHKDQLVKMLRTEGDNPTADKVAAQLPDEIDSERDAAALEAVGLTPTQRMAKLAGGASGTTLSP